MFTGLIQKVGRLVAAERASGGMRLTVGHSPWDTQIELGESIAVNGACLTVAATKPELFVCDILDETGNRTNLTGKTPGAPLNLERALAVGDRFGGHIVSGHVDGEGTLTDRRRTGRDWTFAFECSQSVMDDMIVKGSVACDGVSLTVTSLSANGFEVCVIPFTIEHTNFSELAIGDTVNLETDIIGKYVRRHMSDSDGHSKLTMDKLRDAGFVQ